MIDTRSVAIFSAKTLSTEETTFIPTDTHFEETEEGYCVLQTTLVDDTCSYNRVHYVLKVFTDSHDGTRWFLTTRREGATSTVSIGASLTPHQRAFLNAVVESILESRQP